MYGAEAVIARLAQISGRMGDLSPIMKAIGDRGTLQTKRRFLAGGPAPDGTRWATPRTPNPKRKGTLLVSGQLMGNIHPEVLSPNAVAIGTNKEYGAIHQFGGKIHKNAQSRKTSHRTDAKGNLLRTELFGGKGLVFAKKSNKRVLTRWFEIGEHDIDIPARPYIGISREDSEELLGIINEWIMGR
jgi:phage gpG-like protein